MNILCALAAAFLFYLVFMCINAGHLFLAFLLVIGAVETTYHAAGMTGKHYTESEIAEIKQEAIKEHAARITGDPQKPKSPPPPQRDIQ